LLPRRVIVLIDAVGQRAPLPLVRMLRDAERRVLSADETAQLVTLLSDELLTNGLRSDDEPTEYGRALDDLISHFAVHDDAAGS
jgi:hypothetical protein